MCVCVCVCVCARARYVRFPEVDMSLIRSGADKYLDRFEQKDFSPDLECLHEESDSEVAKRCQQVLEYLGMSFVYLREIFIRL